ncbi:hypothetical protein ADUPG1_010925, partial [Aduncisulcus paluster]
MSAILSGLCKLSHCTHVIELNIQIFPSSLVGRKNDKKIVSVPNSALKAVYLKLNDKQRKYLEIVTTKKPLVLSPISNQSKTAESLIYTWGKQISDVYSIPFYDNTSTNPTSYGHIAETKSSHESVTPVSSSTISSHKQPPSASLPKKSDKETPDIGRYKLPYGFEFDSSSHGPSIQKSSIQ